MPSLFPGRGTRQSDIKIEHLLYQKRTPENHTADTESITINPLQYWHFLGFN